MKTFSTSWADLLLTLRTTSDEKQLLKLLKDEQRGQNRIDRKLRIYSRYSKVRRDRELQELQA